MKLNIFVLVLFLGISTATLAQKSDKEAIKATLMNYIEGGTYGDTIRMIAAFHPSASMKWVDNKTGEFRDVPIKEYLDRAKSNAGKKSDRKGKVVYMDFEGSAGQARVELVYDTFKFIDFFNLLKINGEWKIVSKIFYREDTEKQ